MEDPGLLLFFGLILAGSAFMVTLVNTNAAIVLLIFSMLLSPEIHLAELPQRAVVIRFDDLLLVVVFFSWLGKLAINKQLGLIRSTPLNVPVAAFIVCCLVSTGLGVLNGTVASPIRAAFYLLKYIEYFLLFFMVANVISQRRQVELFLRGMFVTAVIVCLYAYWQMMTYGVGFRTTAPFEGSPEPNTLAGYLLVIISAALGVAIYTRSQTRRLVLLALVAFMLPPFIFTYSRGGYAALMLMSVTLVLLTRRHKLVLVCLLVLGCLAAPVVLPSSVFERIASTFDPRSTIVLGGAEGIGGFRLAASPAQRLLVWKMIFQKWMEHPWLGFGVTGIGFVDNQNARVLGELGIVGALVYIWVRWRLFAVALRNLRSLQDPLAQGLSLGFCAGLAGLILHSFAGDIFIIVRIMEPFWFLAAIIVVLPTLASEARAPTPKPAHPAGIPVV